MPFPLRSSALACAALGVIVSVGCLFPSLDGLSAPGADAHVDADANGDAPTDGGAPGALANAMHVAAATGNAQQTHIIWAAASKRWWLFYIDDDTMKLKTRSSPDFITWVDGQALTLGHTNAGEGRNFSVAYAQLGGADVVHVSLSHVVDADAGPLIHAHARGIISGDAISFASPVDTTSVNTYVQGPDSPVTFVDTAGMVWDSTGFVISQNTSTGVYNEDVFASPTQDNGASWTNAFNQTTVEIAKVTVNARAFINAGGLGATWIAGDQAPSSTNLRFAELTAGTWGSPFSIFNDAGAQDSNDWSVAALTTSQSVEGHVVRALLAGGYQHAYGTGGSGANAVAPAAQPRMPGTGVLLLADPTHLAALDVLSSGELMMSRWDGAAWSGWSAIAPAAPRTFLSGFCPNLDAHPEAGGCAVIWTAPNGGGSYVIAGKLVSVR